MTNRAIVTAVALAAVFLIGFVPQCGRANWLDSELRQSREAYAGADLRDLIGLAYLQANQKNYGLASYEAPHRHVGNFVWQAPSAAKASKGLRPTDDDDPIRILACFHVVNETVEP
jgi:hypothetical protein